MRLRRSDYAANWSIVSADIKKRDNYKCRICGVSDGCLDKKGNNVVLQVHHINEDPLNHNAPYNTLITLCKPHHGTLHLMLLAKKKKYGNRFTEQSTLFDTAPLLIGFNISNGAIELNKFGKLI